MHPATNLCKVAATCCLLLLSPVQARGEATPEAEPFGLIGRVLGAVFSGDKGNKGNKGNGGGDGGGGGGDLTDGYGAPSSGYGAPTDSYGAPSCACRRIFNFLHGGKKRRWKRK